MCSAWCEGKKQKRVKQRDGRDCTFAQRPLQQVMFGLQFGDEITALQKLPEFLWRIESNYMVAPRVLAGAPALRQQSAIRQPRAKDTLRVFLKPLSEHVHLQNGTGSWLALQDGNILGRATPPLPFSTS